MANKKKTKRQDSGRPRPIGLAKAGVTKNRARIHSCGGKLK